MKVKVSFLLCIITLQSNNGMFESAKFKPIDYIPMIPFSEAKDIAFTEETRGIPSLAAQTTKLLSNQLIEVVNNNLIDQWSSYENRIVPIEPSFMTVPIKELPSLFAARSNLLELNRQLYEETKSNSLVKAFITITFAMTENDTVGKQLFSFLFKQPVRMRNHKVIEIIKEKSIQELFFYIKTIPKIKFKVDLLECVKSSPEEVQTLYLLNKLYKQQKTETKGAQLIGCSQSIIDALHYLSPELRFQLFHNHKLYIYKEGFVTDRLTRGYHSMKKGTILSLGMTTQYIFNTSFFAAGKQFTYSENLADSLSSALKPIGYGSCLVGALLLTVPLITAPAQRTCIKTDDKPETSPSATVAVPLHYV